MAPEWNLSSDREEVWRMTEKRRRRLTEWLADNRGLVEMSVAGVHLGSDAPATVPRGEDGLPAFEVHSVRPSHRIAPDGGAITDLILEVTQSRRGYLDPAVQARAEKGKGPKGEPDFWYRGGCTLLFDLQTGAARYCVKKDIGSEGRLDRQRRWLAEPEEGALSATYYRGPKLAASREPFALLHRSFDQREAG